MSIVDNFIILLKRFFIRKNGLGRTKKKANRTRVFRKRKAASRRPLRSRTISKNGLKSSPVSPGASQRRTKTLSNKKTQVGHKSKKGRGRLKSSISKPSLAPDRKAYLSQRSAGTPRSVIQDKDNLREICVGEITHVFSRIQVIVLKLTHEGIAIGQQIHIKGRNTNFCQEVVSLQIESADVKSAKKGQLVGLKIKQSVQVGDKVFKC